MVKDEGDLSSCYMYLCQIALTEFGLLITILLSGAARGIGFHSLNKKCTHYADQGTQFTYEY